MITPEAISAARDALHAEVNARSILVGAIDNALYWERTLNVAVLTTLTEALDATESGKPTPVSFDLLAVQVAHRRAWESSNKAVQRVSDAWRDREDAFAALGTLPKP